MNTPFVATLLVTFGAALASAGVPAQPTRHAGLAFEGRALLALSDADMVASAYVDGRLGASAGSDALTVIRLDADPAAWRTAAVTASNSVAGPPVALATTPDGRYAFVVETFAPRPQGAPNAVFSDLQTGSRLQVVDLGDVAKPRVVQVVDTPRRPDAVSVSSDGRLLALTVHPEGDGRDSPLLLFPISNGRLGVAETPPLPRWRPGERLIHAEFHPHEPVLALVNETRGEVGFVRVAGAPGGHRLDVWGNVVQVEKAPYMLRFTPDGRHALVNALYWGADVQGYWNEAPRGGVLSLRLAAHRGADGQPVHALVSRATTGVSPEGLAISPDGNWVVTTNLERSYLPFDDPRQTWFSSLTLLRLDAASGALTRIDDYAYDGILPEAAAFDASSRFLAVVTFDHYDRRAPGGSVDIWRLAGDPLDPARIALVRTTQSVPVTRGAHSLLLLR